VHADIAITLLKRASPGSRATSPRSPPEGKRGLGGWRRRWRLLVSVTVPPFEPRTSDVGVGDFVSGIVERDDVVGERLRGRSVARVDHVDICDRWIADIDVVTGLAKAKVRTHRRDGNAAGERLTAGQPGSKDKARRSCGAWRSSCQSGEI